MTHAANRRNRSCDRRALLSIGVVIGLAAALAAPALAADARGLALLAKILALPEAGCELKSNLLEEGSEGIGARYCAEASFDVAIEVACDDLDLSPTENGMPSGVCVEENGVAADGWSWEAARSVDGKKGSGRLVKTFCDEGATEIDVVIGKGSGKRSLPAGRLVLDRTAPRIEVEFDGDDAQNGGYFPAARTASITVIEANFDPGLIEFDTTGAVGDWAGDGDAHRVAVSFGEDGEHRLRVAARDLAGNASTDFDSEVFVVDTLAPSVEITCDKAPTGSFAGVDYYNEDVTATVSVTDENFDASTSRLRVRGSKSESAWAHDESDPRVWTKAVAFGEGEGRSILVEARDLAGNTPEAGEAGLALGPLSIDTAAPEAVRAGIDGTPASNYDQSCYFFNRAASLFVEFSDNIGLESVQVVDDGDGFYNRDLPLADGAGKKTARVPLALADGHEIDRDVLVKARDLAGNERCWSVSPSGTVRVVDEREVENPSVFPPWKIHPETLLRDTVAPRLLLSGAEEGSFCNVPQVVDLTVDELNMAYLLAHEPDQPVLTVTKREGDAGRSQSTWTRSVADLAVTGRDELVFTDEHGVARAYDRYGLSETFSEDGHYAIEAQVTDCAKNQGTARLAEFTVDRTAPVARVDFDNNEVRNGKYYRAARTATVSVAEHNFDAALFKIETTGVVGAWVDDGDTHTAVISFASAGTHSLKVSGEDKAGNKMAPYAADEFVIDLTPPTVAISGIEDAHAYNGEVAPRVSFGDEANFDPDGASWVLAGAKNGEVHYEAAAVDGEQGREVAFADFERVPGVDDVYTLTARATDLAGNEAEATATFSVNRFGSTFRVVDADAYRQNNGYLTCAREVVVEEVNVSGVASEEHGATVTQGTSVRELERTEEPEETGYAICEGVSEAEGSRGWALYRYVIAAGNFMGDGRYHVSVRSSDLAENVNTSSGFYDRAANGEAAAEVSFILDETDPVITGLSVNDGDVIEADEYEGTFRVVENIGVADVKVFVDGQEAMAKGDEYGNYSFRVKKAAFTDRELEIVATDFAGRTGEAKATGFRVTTSILELHPAWVAGIVVAILACLAAFVLVRHRYSERRASR